MKNLLIGSLLTILSVTSVQAWEYPAPQNLFEQPSYDLPSDFTDANPVQDYDFGLCASFPRPVVGQKTKYIKKALDEDYSSLTIIREVTEVTDTSLSENITTTGDKFFKYTDTNFRQDFTIKTFDGKTYKDVRKIASDSVIYLHSYLQSLTTQSVETHNGRNYFPLYSVCMDQNWDFYTHSYTIKRLVNSSFVDSEYHYIWPYNEIQDVHVTKKVSAGSFDTFKHYTLGSLYGFSETVTRWIDLKTGITILEETRDSDGTLLSTLELQKIYP